MTINVRLYSKKHAKVSISHGDVKFEPEMYTKEELDNLVLSLKRDIEVAENVIDNMESY